MLEIFKKKEPEKPVQPATQPVTVNSAKSAPVVDQSYIAQNIETKKDSVLEPPKNLPDLAKDMFGIDQSSVKAHSELEAYAAAIRTPEAAPPPRKPIEPTSISVPKLDINLIKNRPNDSKPTLVPIAPIPVAAMPETKNVNPDDELKTFMERSLAEFLRNKTEIAPAIVQNTVQYPPANYIYPIHQTRNSGFFNEFERYVMGGDKTQSVSKEVFNELTSSNLLEKMRNYHEDSQATSKFAELEDLERLWTISRERSKSAIMLNEYLESEILYKSENLKKAIGGDNAMRLNAKAASVIDAHPRKMPLDIFQILRKKTVVQKADKTVEVPIGSAPAAVADPGHLIASDAPSLAFEKDIISNIVITDPARYFYVADGVVVKSLRELLSEVARMTDSTYNYHVTREKNDFANWIRGVFNLPELAEAVAMQNSRIELLNFLARIVI